MAKINRWAIGKDANEKEIIKQLRSIPGVTVETEKDDFLIGRVIDGIPRTFWIELKNPKLVGKDGEIIKSAIKPDQQRILDNWTGDYHIVWNIEQILEIIGLSD